MLTIVVLDLLINRFSTINEHGEVGHFVKFYNLSIPGNAVFRGRGTKGEPGTINIDLFCLGLSMSI